MKYQPSKKVSPSSATNPNEIVSAKEFTVPEPQSENQQEIWTNDLSGSKSILTRAINPVIEYEDSQSKATILMEALPMSAAFADLSLW